LDSDILVNPDAPDIFELYRDEKTIYMSSESKYGDKTTEISNLFAALGTVSDWQKEEKYNIPKYYNSGVILFSKQSRLDQYFNLNEVEKIFNAVRLIDQTYFNYLIFKHHLTHCDIDDKFNWTALFCNHQTRMSAYFIHHNHQGFEKNRISTFRKDYYYFYKNDPISEQITEMVLAKLFKLNQLKKYLNYRMVRLNPIHWRWLQQLREKK
jgi:hypothetical protein